MSSSQTAQRLEAICKKPQNILCADCNNKNPSWASIDFGVLVCLNCSGAHRALGPSVTRVRSIRLDEWQSDWIPYLSLGNLACNQYLEFNLNKNKKPCNNSSQEYINGFVHDKYLKRKYVNPNVANPMDSIKGVKTAILQSQSKGDISQQTKEKKAEVGNKQKKTPFETNGKGFAESLTNFQTRNPGAGQNKREICSLKVLANTLKKPKKEVKEVDFDFNFSNFKAKKEDFNQFSESFSKFPSLQRAQSQQVPKPPKYGIAQPSNSKEEHSPELSPEVNPLKHSEQYTFDDIFVKSYPPIKTIKNADPFGIL